MPLAPLVRRAREEPEESLALLDPLVLLEREELPVTVVSQVKMVLLVLRAPLETVVFLVLAGLRVALATPVVQESLVFLEPEVLLVAPETLDLREKLDLAVHLVRMVALAHLDQWEPVDSLA